MQETPDPDLLLWYLVELFEDNNQRPVPLKELAVRRGFLKESEEKNPFEIELFQLEYQTLEKRTPPHIRQNVGDNGSAYRTVYPTEAGKNHANLLASSKFNQWLTEKGSEHKTGFSIAVIGLGIGVLGLFSMCS